MSWKVLEKISREYRISFSELVYSTNNINELDCENGWDGKHQISGIDLPFGAYIYQMYYQDFDGWKHQESSEIIIIR